MIPLLLPPDFRPRRARADRRPCHPLRCPIHIDAGFPAPTGDMGSHVSGRSSPCLWAYGCLEFACVGGRRAIAAVVAPALVGAGLSFPFTRLLLLQLLHLRRYPGIRGCGGGDCHGAGARQVIDSGLAIETLA